VITAVAWRQVRMALVDDHILFGTRVIRAHYKGGSAVWRFLVHDFGTPEEARRYAVECTATLEREGATLVPPVAFGLRRADEERLSALATEVWVPCADDSPEVAAITRVLSKGKKL
jgi:hypothetical protein